MTLDIFFDKVMSLMYFPHLKIYFTHTGLSIKHYPMSPPIPLNSTKPSVDLFLITFIFFHSRNIVRTLSFKLVVTPI